MNCSFLEAIITTVNVLGKQYDVRVYVYEHFTTSKLHQACLTSDYIREALCWGCIVILIFVNDVIHTLLYLLCSTYVIVGQYRDSF